MTAEITRLIANPREIDTVIIGEYEKVAVVLRKPEDAENLEAALMQLASEGTRYSVQHLTARNKKRGNKINYTLLSRAA